jgi:hypothetical protein
MKIAVSINGIGARMRRLVEERAVDRLQVVLGDRRWRRVTSADEAPVEPDRNGDEALSAQLKL